MGHIRRPQQSAHCSTAPICEVLSDEIQDFSLEVFIADMNNAETVWQLQPRPRRFAFPEQAIPINLRELLAGPTKMTMKEKRRLAVILAYSVFLYHDSAWLSNGWIKDDIAFFNKAEEEPCVEFPFLSTSTESKSSSRQALSSVVYHRNTNILALGILFVEIFNERPIEAWRTRHRLSQNWY